MSGKDWASFDSWSLSRLSALASGSAGTSNNGEGDSEKESFWLKALSKLNVSSESQQQLVELAKKIVFTVKKMKTLLSTESDKSLQLTWWEVVSPMQFMFSRYEKIEKENPEVAHNRAVHDGAQNVAASLLNRLSYYIEFADMAYDGDADETLTRFLERVGYTEVFHHDFVSPENPAFYMAFDPKIKSVIIGIKGTSTMSDVLTDVLCSTSQFGDGHFAHDGMKNAAAAVLKKCKIFIQELFEVQNYKYTIVGHSLGAGTAALLAVMIKEELKIDRVECYAVACPPVLDKECALATRDYIYSLVNGRDIIPRTSLSNMRIMNKNLSVIKEMLDNGVKDEQLVKEGKTSINDLSADDMLNLAKDIGEQYKLPYEEDLYVPGRVFYMFKGVDGQFETLEKDGTLTTLRQPVFAKTMLTDHMCEKYKHAIFESICREHGAPISDPLEVRSIAAAHVACSDHGHFIVPGDSKSETKPVTFYKVVTTLIIPSARNKDSSESSFQDNAVARYTAWHRYSEFEALNKTLLGLSLGDLPGLPSKLIYTSPEARIPIFSKYLQAVITKASKRERFDVLDHLVEFVGGRKDSQIPDFITSQLEAQNPEVTEKN
mmetsp:Transcript_18414/g.22398  ORF Transcript_18414/g.22398 Transcript_18414/m.22398 type:complete len:603 (-) Transcript_18414:1422-3230(-)